MFYVFLYLLWFDHLLSVGRVFRQWGVLITARLAGVCFGLFWFYLQLSPVPPVGVPWRVLSRCASLVPFGLACA